MEEQQKLNNLNNNNKPTVLLIRKRSHLRTMGEGRKHPLKKWREKASRVREKLTEALGITLLACKAFQFHFTLM